MSLVVTVRLADMCYPEDGQVPIKTIHFIAATLVSRDSLSLLVCSLTTRLSGIQNQQKTFNYC